MAKHELSSSKNKVILGHKEFTRYIPAPTSPYGFHQFISHRGFGTLDFNAHPKVLYKNLHEAFGSKIWIRFNGAMYNTFVKANIPKEALFAVSHRGYHWKKLDVTLVNAAVEYNHLVQQAVKDKTLNLLPLMLHTGMDTQQLKQHFGKGLWKRLANTSKSRMAYLAPMVKHNPDWIDVRTGILARHQTFVSRYATSGSYIIAAKIAPTIKDYRQTSDIVFDTMRMAEQCGSEVNKDWSYRRWKEEHETLSKLILTKDFTTVPFTDVVTYQKDGYTFTLLNTQFDIALEGKTMRHCVGSYAKKASLGDYHVFKVEGHGERATLGVRDYVEELKFDQCYGHCNQSVSDRLNTAAHKIVKEHDDYIRLRDGRSAGTGDEGSRSVLDQRRQDLPLYELVRRDALPAANIFDIDWA